MDLPSRRDDVLRLPDGGATRLKVRSIVGLLPLCAASVIEPWEREQVPSVMKLFEERQRRMPELLRNFFMGRGHAERGIFALVNQDRLRRILAYMLDENEFLGPHGIRALSRYHLEHPYRFNVQGQEYKVNYLPGDSDSGMFGGNSNWRGPVWMPVNMMIILRDANGRRPVYGAQDKFQTDPHWRDHLVFPEYFHWDTGAAVGASHRTGWTGLVAMLKQAKGDAR